MLNLFNIKINGLRENNVLSFKIIFFRSVNTLSIIVSTTLCRVTKCDYQIIVKFIHMLRQELEYLMVLNGVELLYADKLQGLIEKLACLLKFIA